MKFALGVAGADLDEEILAMTVVTHDPATTLRGALAALGGAKLPARATRLEGHPVSYTHLTLPTTPYV